MNRNSKGANDQNNHSKDAIELANCKSLISSQQVKQLNLKISSYTWYRDSHGLFDYEEEKKMTVDHFEFKNKNLLLKREGDNLIYETFDNFEEMRQNRKCLEDLQAEHFKKSTATFLLKENNFWIYHRNTIEDSEEEKANPGEKLWLIMRHMANDEDHNFEQGKGYKLELGDTIKFGRVRYKVIMMQNQQDGQQDFMLTDRFQKKKHEQNLRAYGIDPVSVRTKRRRSSTGGPLSGGGTSRSPSPPQQLMISPERQSSIVNIPRFQSQVTQFDAGIDARQGSFYDEDRDDGPNSDNMSQDMGDSDDVSSSDYTGSGDYQDDVSDNVSVRDQDEEMDGIEDLQTVQQADDQTAYNYYTTQQTGLTGVTGVTQDTAVLSPQRARQEFGAGISRFNSVAPADSNPNELPPDFLSDNQQPFMSSQRNQSVNIRDTTGLGQTGVFFSQGRGTIQNNRNLSLVAPGVNYGANTMTNDAIAIQQENNRDKRRRKKYKKNQKQKLKLQLQIEAKAKEAIEGKVCRICLGEENEGTDPLISPCKCAGTMSHIHLECLREWLNSKRSMKEGECVKTYCWKALECELCKVRFPGQVFSDGTSVSDKVGLTSKQIKKMGKPIEILEYDKPESDFIVIESVTLQNIRIVHVINMRDRQFIKVGRGHDADIRVTDISVSRFHARINMTEEGHFYVEDNRSKFGTLIQVRKPFMLEKNKNNYLQMGRSSLQIRVEDLSQINQQQNKSTAETIQQILCCKKAKKLPQMQKEISYELYPSEWNVQKEQPVFDYNNTVVEQTRDDEVQPNIQSNSPMEEQEQDQDDGGLPIIQVLPVGIHNDQNQGDQIEEEKEGQQQIGQDDNAFSVLEDQTIRAIIEEHGMESGNPNGRDQSALQINSNQDIVRSRTEQPSVMQQSDSQIQQEGIDEYLRKQEIAKAIAEAKTGCEKNFTKFEQHVMDQEENIDDSIENPPADNTYLGGVQNDHSLIDTSIQDQTHLLGANNLSASLSPVKEESKLELTGTKNLNSSLVDGQDQITPIKEEDDKEEEGDKVDPEKTMQQIVSEGQSDNQVNEGSDQMQN